MQCNPCELRFDCNDSRWARLFSAGQAAVDDGATHMVFTFASEQKRSVRFSGGLFFDHSAVHYSRFRYPFDRRVAVLKESPIGTTDDRRFLRRNYSTVFTHRKALIDLGHPFKELIFGTNWVPDAIESAGGGVQDHVAPREKTRLCSFVGSIEHADRAGYSLRRAVAARQMEVRAADCYGKGIRRIERKSVALQPYCFSIAMENTKEDYYFTEKLVDCFLTDTVPVYWGCPSISRFFDARGILAFDTLAELEHTLSTLSFDRYRELLPHVLRNRERCFELMVQDYNSYLRRLGRALCADGSPGVWTRRLPPWRRGKAMAGLRFMCSAAAGVSLGGR